MFLDMRPLSRPSASFKGLASPLGHASLAPDVSGRSSASAGLASPEGFCHSARHSTGVSTGLARTVAHASLAPDVSGHALDITWSL